LKPEQKSFDLGEKSPEVGEKRLEVGEKSSESQVFFSKG
jgi:hypothetical protein